MRRKKIKRKIDKQLLDAIFYYEKEWKALRQIVDLSIDPSVDSEQQMLMAQAKYMLLLREAKIRKISFLRYK